MGYHYHFFPEFRQFYSEPVLNDIKTKNPLLPLIQIDVLKRNRREYRGEPFYQIIQNDSIDEFAKCVFKNVTSLNSKIEKKFHEINQFLIPGLHSLIEYAAFYGSVQIFQYLIFGDDSVFINIQNSLSKFSITMELKPLFSECI